MAVPQEGAVHLNGTNGVRDFQVATEQQQRDESAVQNALTHIHVNQQRSLNCRTEAALDKQDSPHCHSLRKTMAACAEVAHHSGKCFCGLIFNQYYNQAPQVSDNISRLECGENTFII